MKKLFLFAALALFAFNAHAQEGNETDGEGNIGWSKGDIYLSGSFGVWSSKTGDFKDNQFNIMPSAGYFFTDHIAAGVQVGYMSSKSEAPGGSTTSEMNTFMIGAGGKYICRPNKQFTPYVGLGFNYMSTKDDISDVTTDGFEVGLGAGLVYGLSEHWYIGANYGVLSYATSEPDVDGAESTDVFTFGLDWKELNFTLAYQF